MNDAEFERQATRIRTLAEWWIPRIGLAWWQIDLAFTRDDFEVDGRAAPDTLAKTHANWRYGHACITWNMPRVAGQSDGDLETAFVHELQHIFLNEARENGKDWLDHEERVASTYTKAFLWLRNILEGSADHAPQEGLEPNVAHSAQPPAANGVSRAKTREHEGHG